MNDSPIIAIVGFGSLGTLFASLLAPNMPFENLRIVADTDRVNRYQQQGLLVKMAHYLIIRRGECIKEKFWLKRLLILKG